MLKTKLFFTKILAGAIFVSLLSGQSFASPCALTKEKQAIEIRALQTHLMVAALSCSKQKDYNIVMSKFGKYLAENGRVLQAYFSRNYGRTYPNQLNSFVTFLANESSKTSLKQDYKPYCAKADQLFKDILSGDKNMLVKVSAKDEYGYHNIKDCSARSIVAAR